MVAMQNIIVHVDNSLRIFVGDSETPLLNEKGLTHGAYIFKPARSGYMFADKTTSTFIDTPFN